MWYFLVFLRNAAQCNKKSAELRSGRRKDFEEEGTDPAAARHNGCRRHRPQMSVMRRLAYRRSHTAISGLVQRLYYAACR